LLPEQTAQLAIYKCFELTDQGFGPIRGPATELEYWCHLASLVGKPNGTVFEWANGLLLKAESSEGKNFNLLRLWLRSAPSGHIESLINGLETKSTFNETTMRAWAHCNNITFDSRNVTAPYETLIRYLPKGLVGTIFVESDRKKDLIRWGDELFGSAIKYIGNAPIARQSGGKTRLVLGKNDGVKHIGFEFNDSRPRASTSTVSSWGVNLGSFSDVFQNKNGWEERFQQEFEKWKSDEVALESWTDSDFFFFGSWRALGAYYSTNPNAFADKTEAVLGAALKDLDSQFHLGGFLYAIISFLLPDAPLKAWGYFQKLNSGSLGIHISSEFDVPEFYVRLWDLKLCHSAEHEQLRLYLFEDCENEFEIMTLSVAALANNAHGELFNIIRRLLNHPLAKNRALAVSILCWVGTEESNSILGNLKSNDPSSWVREHAEWALEVGLQEENARSHFRNILSDTDGFLVSAALQVLKPALSPVARWWRHQVRAEEEAKGLILQPKIAAILESFWCHWEGVRYGNIAVADIKLDEYCRGERLDQLKTPRIAPWWNL
jgi:hypothetical protein